MKISGEQLQAVSDSTGFRPEMVEKVIHLMNLLNKIRSHPFLKNRIVLKGGTALNLFVFDLPRLSIDIDLNYVGGIDREKMLFERPGVESAMRQVFSREDFTVKRMPDEHAGGKWRLAYQGAAGRGNLEVDLNFMFREPLWNVVVADSKALGGYKALNIPILDIHELAAGKLSALFSRRQARDLFDSYQLLDRSDLDPTRLRVAFVVYGALNRKDWRTITLGDIAFDPAELQRMLKPVLNKSTFPLGKKSTRFARRLVDECREKLGMVFPFSDPENEFLENVLSKGKIIPKLLTTDKELQMRIRRNPMLNWKTLHVRKHFGIE